MCDTVYMSVLVPISGRVAFLFGGRDAAFATVAGVIMFVALFYLKLGADATLFAHDGRVAPAFFFFGDYRTLSKRVQSIAARDESFGLVPNTTYSMDAVALRKIAATLYADTMAEMAKWTDTAIRHIVVPAIEKYTYV
jgi:hypothetical protein